MFGNETLAFLEELGRHNNREWFEANRRRYEAHVRGPALEFVEAMAPALQAISPNFVAIPKKMGGSLMRVYRDTRFSPDKTPYKTNIGIQFRHALGKDVHAPGFYVHIAPYECFLGVGCWRPEPDALRAIRDRIAGQPAQWLAARDDAGFRQHYALDGDSLSRPPRGYAADHPAIEDLKRKDYIGISPLGWEDVGSHSFAALVAQRFAAAAPFQRFLCEALGVAY